MLKEINVKQLLYNMNIYQIKNKEIEYACKIYLDTHYNIFYIILYIILYIIFFINRLI